MTNQAPETGSIAKKHLRGSSLLLLGRLVGLLTNFVVQVLTVRYLAKADYGIYAFALAVVAVGGVIAALGMDKTASRFLALYLENRQYTRFWGAMRLLLGTVLAAGMTITLAFIAAWAVGGWPGMQVEPATLAVLAVVGGLSFCEALDALFVSLLAVLCDPKAIFLRRHLLGPLFKLSAAGIVIAASGSLLAFALAQLLAGLLGVAICVPILLRSLAKHKDLWAARATAYEYPYREIYGYSATLLAGDLSYLVRGSLVPIVIGLYHASEEVADYQAVAPLARLNELALMTFSVLFLPSAAKLRAANLQADLQSLYEQTNLWITLLSYPVFAICVLAADAAPVLLFGQRYLDVGPILSMLALGYFTNAAFGANLRLLRAVAKPAVILGVDLLIMLAAIPLVMCLATAWGAFGGAIAMCGAYLLQTVVYQAAASRYAGAQPLRWKCWGPYVIGVLLTAGLWQAQRSLNLHALFGFVTASVASGLMLAIFIRHLELANVFPELSRLPVLGKFVRLQVAGTTPAKTSEAR